MSHFLIYLPGAQGQSPELLEAAGLADFVAGAEFLQSPGPDGGRGAICAWRKPGHDPRVNFAPSEQTWIRQAVERPLYYAGIWNDKPPLPEELLRPYPYRGRQFALGDGQQWLLPFARELPRDLVLSDDGGWRFEVQRRFYAFWLECQNWIEDLVSSGDPNIDRDSFVAKVSYLRMVEFLIRALRINYRLLPEVASHLRLFDTLNSPRAVTAVIASLET